MSTHVPSTRLGGLQLETVHLRPSRPAAGHPAPLVFLHEGLGSVALWRDWPQQLCHATGRTGWVVSRHGYGQSDPVADVRGPTGSQAGPMGPVHTGRRPPDYMHREAWHTLPALLAAWGVERPVLVGHSDGATIALLHAARFGVSACVAMAPHLRVEAVSIAAIEAAQAQFESGDLRQRLARFHRDVEGAFWQWNDVWLSAGFRSFDTVAESAAITAPVLALQGVDDAYGTLAQLAWIQAPRCRRIALPRCGHSPHREQPQLTTTLIQRWLTEVQAA